MRSLLRQLTISVVLLSGVPGCSLLPPPDPAEIVGGSVFPAQSRGITLDEQQIPSYAELHGSITPLLSEISTPLTPAECACRAAAQSQTAAILDREAAHLRREVCVHHRRGVSHLLPEILADQAQKERNDAAKQALIAYYRLAEVQLQQELLLDSYQEQQRTQDTIDGLLTAGLPVETDRSELQRQRYQLDQQGLQLSYDQVRSTGQVKSLIGDDPLSPESIETVCAIEPRAAEYGLTEAVETGRANDVQLRALRRFLNEGEVDDLPVARTLLKTASPLLGQAPAALGLLAKLKTALGHDNQGDEELSDRKKQLHTLYAARQQQVDLEVVGEVLNAQQRYYEVGVAKDVLDSWDDQVLQHESNREVQRSDYADVVAARAERLKAKSDLLHKLIELEIAHVQLKSVLGILGQECAATSSP